MENSTEMCSPDDACVVVDRQVTLSIRGPVSSRRPSPRAFARRWRRLPARQSHLYRRCEAHVGGATSTSKGR